MADNVTIPATGSGTATPVVATDDIGGVHHQLVKLEWGPADTANQTDTASGKPLPVQLRGSDGTDRSQSLPVTIASGGVASGAIASGAIASGAVASGAIASGAVASGAIALGAIARGATSIAEDEDQPSGGGDTGVKVLFKRTDTPANASGADGDYEQPQMSGGGLWVKPLSRFVTVSTNVTRPADTTAYAVNDCLSDSTSSPTSGGFTFTSAARASGGSGIITDAIISSSNDPATPLQGELWIFDTSVTNVNDNAAFVVSDSEIQTLVATIPFVLTDSGNNDSAHIQNLSIGFTCSGSANLRFLYRVKNAYTPASGEVITARLKILQLD